MMGPGTPSSSAPRLFGPAIFLGAFLLFLVQPLVGRQVLPWFGGTAAVWTACLLFFQMALLLGYLYAHALVRFLAPGAQFLLHAALLVLALGFLPPTLDPSWKPVDPSLPAGRILAVLGRSVGLPFLLLASTGPLLQAWFHREAPDRSPYRLFALSNMGSMLALLAYPLLLEPLLRLREQAWAWSVGFGTYACMVLLLGWRRRQQGDCLEPRPDAKRSPLPAGTWIMWILLAACPSILLLAVTAHVTSNIAPVPLLWIVPLALYLLSFILCFDGRGWYRRGIILPLALAGLLALVLLSAYSRQLAGPLLQLPVAGLALFGAAMGCHGELARQKPHPSRLTAFYLAVASGGALGGLLVGLVAPVVFRGRHELLLGAMLFAALVWVLSARERAPGARWLNGACGLLFAVAGALWMVGSWLGPRPRIADRNFYGTVRVLEGGEGPERTRSFVDGAILHGAQYLDPERLRWPTTYFGTHSGIGQVMTVAQRRGPVHVGVVGLGVGTLAAYGRPGDRFRFYEINPLAIDLARSEFRFLADCPSSVDVVPGDARLSLEREAPRAYDLLVLDAFSGDAIPVHLVTLEALDLYLRHLKPDGFLCFNVSNRFVDLAPVLQGAARKAGLAYAQLDSAAAPQPGCVASRWLVMARDPGRLVPLQAFVPVPLAKKPSPPWTDDHSSLWQVVKL